MAIPTELEWQDEIVSILKEEQGYQVREKVYYDRNNAIIKDDFLAFVKDTQPGIWEKYTEDEIIQGLIYALNEPHKYVASMTKHDILCPSILDIWRHGFELGRDRDKVFIVYWRPRDDKDKESEQRYKQNRLSVVPELEYGITTRDGNNRLDLALFVNGIPVITVELKNQFTGQGSGNAVEQYRCTRSPDAPIFKFPHRAIAHFAVDRQNARVTTRLNGEETFFLPYNRGRDGGAGNPPFFDKSDKERESTAYLWCDFEQLDDRPGATGPRYIKAAWSKERILNILHHYATIELPNSPEEFSDPLKRSRAGTLIFPRYHQYDVLDDIFGHIAENGSGHNYLIKHSTGSGKSFTMAWLAHELLSFFDNKGEKVFQTILIVTDRIQLDKQLRDLITSVGGDSSVSIAKDTKDLGKALTKRSNNSLTSEIITTTLQKFASLEQRDLRGKELGKIAIIIDEAHRSQGNILQKYMENVLMISDAGSKEQLSYFAFTATPTERARELFGIGEPGNKIPFHIYGMRQAREEGMIVDVLQNMIFKTVATNLETDKPDKEVSDRDVKTIAAIQQEIIDVKVDDILNHIFSRGILHKLNGHGKAMILAPRVEGGVRYFRTLKKQIKERNLVDAKGNPLKVLIAFTGEHTDPENKNARISEKTLNDDGLEGLSVIESFRDTHHILVAVDKYQTGFNEPRLMAMYVDKSLNGINAVQTLSRLNRQFKGLKVVDTNSLPHVVDYFNEPDTIIAPFIEEDSGSLEGGYQFINEPYVDALYSALNEILDENYIDEFKMLETEFQASRITAKYKNPGESAAYSGAFAHFFAQQYENYKDLSNDRKYRFEIDLYRFISHWPLACIVLKDAYSKKPDVRSKMEDYSRFAKHFYNYIKHSKPESADKPGRLKSEDVRIEGNITLIELQNAENIREHIENGRNGGEPVEPVAKQEARPMEYTVAKRRRRVPKTIVELIERYNSTTGILVENAEQQGIEAGKVLPFIERIVNEVHKNGILVSAANNKANSESQYMQLYERVFDNVLHQAKSDSAKDTGELEVLNFLSKQYKNVCKELAADSYNIHTNGEEVA